MKLVSALVGLAALGGVALSPARRRDARRHQEVSTTTVAVPAGYICNEWGHCWHRHYYGGGSYYHPHYRGGYGRYRHWGGWGGGYGWHHWHQW